MTAAEARQRGEEVAAKYNPTGLYPFPFECITDDLKDLKIIELEGLKETISGAISYMAEPESFSIIINSRKPKNRKYFTLAHELGHYFLHRDALKASSQKMYIDTDHLVDVDGILYRDDGKADDVMEREANNFAGALLMPEAKVREVWGKLKNAQQCAEVFGVSLVAMSFRLQILKLADTH